MSIRSNKNCCTKLIIEPTTKIKVCFDSQNLFKALSDAINRNNHNKNLLLSCKQVEPICTLSTKKSDWKAALGQTTRTAKHNNFNLMNNWMKIDCINCNKEFKNSLIQCTLKTIVNALIRDQVANTD